MKLTLPVLLLLCVSANAQEKFTVYFEFNQAITNQNMQHWIDENPHARIQKIYGYTDKSGDAVYNQELSERRAAYIYERLKGSTVEFDNVDQKGFGESQSSTSHNDKDRKVVVYYAAPQIYEVSAVKTEFGNKIAAAAKGDKIVLKNVYFRGGTAFILKESAPALKELYVILRDNPKLKIDLQGHICCQTTDLDNLSEKRAVEIFLYLKNNGINEKRMTFRGFGSTRPIHPLPEKSPDDMIDNRRVEIEIIDK